MAMDEPLQLSIAECPALLAYAQDSSRGNFLTAKYSEGCVDISGKNAPDICRSKCQEPKRRSVDRLYWK